MILPDYKSIADAMAYVDVQSFRSYIGVVFLDNVLTWHFEVGDHTFLIL